MDSTVRTQSDARPNALSLIVAAFGDPGHVFPAISLARALQARGHEVLVESWEQWRGAAERVGLEFTAAQQYTVYPPPGADSDDGRTAADAAQALVGLIEDFEPDVVVSDILTLAPALAAEVAGVRRATLIPHVYPVQEPGLPLFTIGALPPRTPIGRAAWRLPLPLLKIGLRQGLRDLNATRERLGLEPLERFHGGISAELALVATYPPARVPALAREGAGHRADVLRAALRGDRGAGGRGAAGPGGAEHGAGPDVRDAARRARRAGRRAGAGRGDDQQAPADRAARGARATRCSSRG